MDVVANGQVMHVAGGATVADLLSALGLTGRVVVVERNGEPVGRAEVPTTVLAEGDCLEVVRAVAGG